MKRLIKKDSLNAIWFSIVAGILLSQVFEPIIKIGKNLGDGLIVALVDYFYYSCGQASSTSFVNYIACFVFLFVLCPVVKNTIAIILDFRKKEDIATSSSTEVVSEESPKTLDDIIETGIKLKAKNKRKMLYLKIVLVICAIILILTVCDVTIYKYGSTIVKESFDRKITQITPYTENEKIALLKSDWVSMKSKSDYDKIEERINSILEENNLK